MVVMVTGGSGFIGSAVVRHLVDDLDEEILNVDKLTYASSVASTSMLEYHSGYQFVQADICDRDAMDRILRDFRPRGIIHLAAESHVDRSIDKPGDFVQANVLGTLSLLEATRAYLSSTPNDTFSFVHVSTDEVYGTLGDDGHFSERSPYLPTSPYSASKAASDHLARAWYHTYGLPTIVTNCSNNYGPYQFPEKLIPVVILNAIRGQSIPVYGKGTNVRDWLHVEDHARALGMVLEGGRPGRTYTIGGGNERNNLTLVQMICSMLDEMKPRARGGSHEELISFVDDRPGHDQRYAIDPTTIEQELGWEPRYSLETGLRQTVEWYLDNLSWCIETLEGLGLQRQGLLP